MDEVFLNLMKIINPQFQKVQPSPSKRSLKEKTSRKMVKRIL